MSRKNKPKQPRGAAEQYAANDRQPLGPLPKPDALTQAFQMLAEAAQAIPRPIEAFGDMSRWQVAQGHIQNLRLGLDAVEKMVVALAVQDALDMTKPLPAKFTPGGVRGPQAVGEFVLNRNAQDSLGLDVTKSWLNEAGGLDPEIGARLETAVGTFAILTTAPARVGSPEWVAQMRAEIAAHPANQRTAENSTPTPSKDEKA